jgi:hypothetical protein
VRNPLPRVLAFFSRDCDIKFRGPWCLVGTIAYYGFWTGDFFFCPCYRTAFLHAASTNILQRGVDAHPNPQGADTYLTLDPQIRAHIARHLFTYSERLRYVSFVENKPIPNRIQPEISAWVSIVLWNTTSSVAKHGVYVGGCWIRVYGPDAETCNSAGRNWPSTRMYLLFFPARRVFHYTGIDVSVFLGTVGFSLRREGRYITSLQLYSRVRNRLQS